MTEVDIHVSEQDDGQGYWEEVAPKLWVPPDKKAEKGYGSPLRPNSDEMGVHEGVLVEGGDALVLGATEELCLAAYGLSKTVTSVDYAQNAINTLRINGVGTEEEYRNGLKVKYIRDEWIRWLTGNSEKKHNIMTDGGPLCLALPKWAALATLVHATLRSGGHFSARIYTNIDRPPKASYENPNLNRWVPDMAHATEDSNWRVQPQSDPAYKEHNVYYTFPPRDVILQIFGAAGLTLAGTPFVPDYEEGERFATYVWKKS